MRRLIGIVLLIAIAAPARAQSPVRIVTGVSAGATYYCIVSRCGTGQTVGVVADAQPTPAIGLELAVRRHSCFDCDRFVIADAALVLRYPARTIQPFVAAGVSLSSDPGLMGTRAGMLGAAGAWAWLKPAWGAKLELRGRQVGRGDGMGELSLSLAHRFSAGGPSSSSSGARARGAGRP